MEKEINQLYNNRLYLPKKIKEEISRSFVGIVFETKNGKIQSFNKHNRHTTSYKLRANTNLKKFSDVSFVDVLLSTKKRLELHTYKVTRTITKNLNEKFSFKIYNLRIYKEDEIVTLSLNPNGKVESRARGVGALGWYPEYFFYSANLQNIVSKGYLQRSGISLENFNNGYASHKNIVNILERIWRNKDMLEYLNNIKAASLHKSVINGNADMRKLSKKIVTSNKHTIKTYNPSYKALLDIDILKEKISMTKINLESIVNGLVTVDFYEETMSLESELSQPDFKIFNYLVKRKCSPNYYNDYLNMLKELEVFNLEKRTLYPKDLITAHDRLVDMINNTKNQRKNKKMSKVLRNTEKMHFSFGEFLLTSPKTVNDIVNEGRFLNHCVGSAGYIDNHIEGKTIILFIRTTKEPNRPLFTVEYKKGKIKQCRGQRNTSAPEEIQEFLNEWEKFIKKEVQHEHYQ